MDRKKTAMAVAALLLALPFAAAGPCGFGVEILVDGEPLAEYNARGKTYVEALRGKEYAVRLTNPLGRRVAVALSVDGLNTVDGRRSDARTATKWVLEPYQSIVISGWQVSGREARRFFFTTEKGSYAARMGRTEDLGLVEAVFFAERLPEPPQEVEDGVLGGILGGSGSGREAPAPAPSGEAAPSPPQSRSQNKSLSDEYAATGMGRRTEHPVARIHLDLEPFPSADLRIRYEFREGLVELGILPPPRTVSPLQRRERARGFEGAFCPER
ncbi:MAG: hypothetical protein ACP5VN_00025 [Acidobacteriota bacterium]